MVVRGRVDNGRGIIYFIDFFDILQFLKSSVVGGGHAHYTRPARKKYNILRSS